MTPAAAFHAHRKHCRICQSRDFGLCAEAARILRAAQLADTPVVETFIATPDEERIALARIYRLLENWALTHPEIPLMIRVPQATEKGRGDQ